MDSARSSRVNRPLCLAIPSQSRGNRPLREPNTHEGVDNVLSTIVWVWIRDAIFGSRSGRRVEERCCSYTARASLVLGDVQQNLHRSVHS